MSSTDFKQLIVPLMFMLLFGLLASTIPTAFFVASAEEYEVDIPPYFRGLDAGAYSLTHNFTVDDGTFDVDVGVGGQRYDYTLAGDYWSAYTTTTYTELRIGRRTYFFGIFLIGIDWLTFTSPEGVDRGPILTGTEMNDDYDEVEGWVKYRMTLSTDAVVGFDCLIGFNTSLYSSPKEALEAEALQVLIGYGIDDLYTSINVWNLIGAMLEFQNPDIPFPVNILIPAIVYIMFGWAVLIVFTKLIPGLGG